MKKSFGEKKASRPVSRILSWCGHSSGRVVSFPLLRPTRNGASDAEVPVWPCSERGLPCRPRCLGRGALLPHHFTLAVRKKVSGLGGMFSAALSVASRRPGVVRRSCSLESGLSSPSRLAGAKRRPPGRLAWGDYSANSPDGGREIFFGKFLSFPISASPL